MRAIVFTALFALVLQSSLIAQDLTPKSKDGKVIKIEKKDFLEHIFNYEKNPKVWTFEGDLPIIVDFYADWCGPCKILAPTLAEIATEYKGKIRVYKVDTDVEKELAYVFNIRSIPSLLFVPAKGDPQMAQGVLPKAEIKKLIDNFLLTSAAQ